IPAMRLLLLLSLLGIVLLVRGSDPATSAQFSGRKLLKSADGSYLRGAFRGPNDNREWFVDLTSRRKHCTKWHVEDHNGRVALKSAYFKDMYLRSSDSGFVDLVNNREDPSIIWIPVKQDGGKWSLMSIRGSWLRFKPDGNVTQESTNAEGQFFLEDW
ncbi:hypothetical protein PRIPAC_84826, partial [Pristionchus pacificus]